jgi:NAD(P)H dehydrogenase (quinone)
MTIKVSVVYHSGYGHTTKVAKYVAEGVKMQPGIDVHIINAAELDDNAWSIMDSSDAIIFGTPTYMGSISAKLKELIEAASGRWAKGEWRNKIAAGFTNSMGMSGDKLNSLIQLFINAMQHGMIWVGMDVMPPFKSGQEEVHRNEINRIGSYCGLMTQSNNDTPDFNPPEGDLETAKLFGQRIAIITTQFISGRK